MQKILYGNQWISAVAARGADVFQKKLKKTSFRAFKKVFSPFLFSQISSNSIPELHYGSDIKSTKCYLYYFMSSVAAR